MFYTVNRTLRSVGLAGIATMALLAQPALAAETSDTLDVSATVTANCVVSTSPIAFGNVDVTTNSNTDATGSISVTCTNGTSWVASADAGSGDGADLAVRKMTSGANLLSYALYTDSNRTSLWGDGVESTATIAANGSGVAQSRTIYGRVLSGQTGVPAGSYADTVTVTVAY